MRTKSKPHIIETVKYWLYEINYSVNVAEVVFLMFQGYACVCKINTFRDSFYVVCWKI